MSAHVSLTMIVKDEEENLPACLASLPEGFQDTVIVDTGSSDRTRDVASRLGARVYDFSWCDDFSAARNEALRHAACPWIFWMDADDRLDGPNRDRLRDLLERLGNEDEAYVMTCISCRDRTTGASSVTEHLRLFRNRPEIRWQNRVHEQIRPAVERCGGRLRQTDILIHHRGYLEPSARVRKAERNLRLLALQDADAPGDPFVAYNIGHCHHVLGRMAEAVSCWQRSLRNASPNAPYLRRLYALLVEGCDQLGQKQRALEFCREGRGRFPDDPELLFREGTLWIELGHLQWAEDCLGRVLGLTAGEYVNYEEPQLRSKARHNLAVLCRQQGRLVDAETQLRQALAEQPGYVLAWLGLGLIWRDQGRWQEVDEAVHHLAQAPELATRAAELRNRGPLVSQIIVG